MFNFRKAALAAAAACLLTLPAAPSMAASPSTQAQLIEMCAMPLPAGYNEMELKACIVAPKTTRALLELNTLTEEVEVQLSKEEQLAILIPLIGAIEWYVELAEDAAGLPVEELRVLAIIEAENDTNAAQRVQQAMAVLRELINAAQ